HELVAAASLRELDALGDRRVVGHPVEEQQLEETEPQRIPNARVELRRRPRGEQPDQVVECRASLHRPVRELLCERPLATIQSRSVGLGAERAVREGALVEYALEDAVCDSPAAHGTPWPRRYAAASIGREPGGTTSTSS